MTTPDTPRLACAYDRVSTYKQAQMADLDTRYIDAIVKHCERRGWDFTPERLFTDPGYSGRSMKRKGLEAAMNWAIEHKGIIVFYDLSRFTRSITDVVWIAENLRKHEAGLSSCTEAIDITSDNPAAELQLHILAAVAQFDSRLKGLKIKNRHAADREMTKSARFPEGYNVMGPQPVCWRLNEYNERVPVPEECEVILRCQATYRSVRRQNYTQKWGAETAKILNKLGVSTPSMLRARRKDRTPRRGDVWTRDIVHYCLRVSVPRDWKKEIKEEVECCS